MPAKSCKGLRLCGHLGLLSLGTHGGLRLFFCFGFLFLKFIFVYLNVYLLACMHVCNVH